ncbi:hypothetical protein SVAN01_06119 [Stagonosporopsis vannaccii]|nr:hypothetical protein SVAN01_06119 [Stagonosporopsis vannaccii]
MPCHTSHVMSCYPTQCSSGALWRSWGVRDKSEALRAAGARFQRETVGALNAALTRGHDVRRGSLGMSRGGERRGRIRAVSALSAATTVKSREASLKIMVGSEEVLSEQMGHAMTADAWLCPLAARDCQPS